MAHVLIVDDHIDTCRPLLLMLEGAGHHAQCVTGGGGEALEVLRMFKPDLLILDLLMPDMGGLEVLRELRADRRYGDLPVVVFFASADGDHKRQAIALGTRVYVTKGAAGWEALWAAIRRIIPPADVAQWN